MLDAIIGDIVGSYIEFHNDKGTDFILLHDDGPQQPIEKMRPCNSWGKALLGQKISAEVLHEYPERNKGAQVRNKRREMNQ